MANSHRRATSMARGCCPHVPPADALNRKLGGEAIPALAIFSPSSPLNPTVLRDSYTSARVIDEVSLAK